MTGDNAKRDEVEFLLPWYAAGTLDRREADLVEKFLAQDTELAKRYELVGEELAGAIHLNESLGAPSARLMKVLSAKLDAEPICRRASGIGIIEQVRLFLAALSPRTIAWSAGTAALVMLVQAGIIGEIMTKQRPASIYVTASVPAKPAMPAVFALVRFAQGSTADDITRFLEINKAVIIDGPIGDGFYRIRVTSPPSAKDHPTVLLERLQHDKVVGFIVPTN